MAIQESERRLDRKLANFKADIRQSQDEAATKAVHRMRRQRKPFTGCGTTSRSNTRRRKAHGEQARFNAQVEETVQEAQEALSTLEEAPALQRALEALEKCARLLAERQMLIKVADRSANGWGVVTEYTADELADDSDDEKCLEKAEKAAERKAGLRKRKRLQPARYPSLPGPAVAEHVRLSVRRILAASSAARWSGCATPRSSFGATCEPGSGAMFCMWRDGASADLLPQDTGPGKQVVSFSHAEA